MNACTQSFTYVGNVGRLKIPFFQRAYVWDNKNWQDLLSALLEFEKNKFLGTLIFKKYSLPVVEANEVLVVDGQQRLTTLSIFLKALYDLFDQELRENSKASLERCLFYKRNPTDKKLLIKIHHSHADAVAYKQVMESNDLINRLETIGSESTGILRCYRFFVEQLARLDQDSRVSLFNELLDDNNSIFAVVYLSEEDNEQEVFQMANATGVKLSL